MGTFENKNQTLSGLPGFTVPTGQTATVTDADTLLVGGKIVPQFLTLSVPLMAADAAARYVFIADAAYQVIAVREIHSVVGGTSCNVMVEKLTGTTTPGSGTAMLTGTIDLTATVKTTVSGALVATAGSKQLAAGDKIGVLYTGTQTGLIGLLQVTLQRI